MNERLELRAGSSSATVFPEDGGRLGQLDLGNGPLLRAVADDLPWSEWGCYPLLPWCNRIPGGHLRFGDIDAQLPVNWPDGTAIHGLVAAAEWNVRAADATTAELTIETSEGPFHVRGEQSFELRPDELTLRLAVTNLARHVVPVGLGIHPWFHAGRVRIPADRKWPGDPMPTGRPVPVGPDDDLRNGRMPPVMDRCFTSLTSTHADAPGVRLHWEGPITQIVVYSGEPGWVCVEPVTMANDGFNIAERGEGGHGVVLLSPDATLEVRYGFERHAE